MADSSYRWVVVAAGGFMGCIAMGSLFSLPVLLTPMAEATGWSRTGISGAMTVGFLAMAMTSMVWGALSDRFGARPVVMSGAALFALSLWLAGHAPSLLLFQASFGVLAGATVAAFFAPMMATVTGWFTTQRSLAVSLVSAGMGLAPVTMSPLAARLAATYDWRTVLSILAAVVAVTTVPTALLLRRPPPQPAMEGPTGDASPEGMTVRQAVTSLPFIVLVLTNFFCCATHSGPIFHTVSYAELCGISALAAVSIYSVEGIAGMGGRIGFGLLGDRFGAKRILVAGLLAQAFGALAYFFARELIQFYVVAAIFGFIYAGIMPLYAVLIRENFPMRMMGTIMGGTGMAGSLGMATGPVLGGWIFDTTGGYGALYLTSFGLGLGAFLVAMTFRPFGGLRTSVRAQAA
ncbi:Oxalate/formate antiporter [Rubellimicrobium mesophilum DSM 19309]|uniref:Oxalate/formate antiporter n=1 Tax=Rubellimicrobium mesophilum DSM 19309 TaxID=442562 RepID=A0A017HP99_9RHOB|nr:MFS transporter [Rubellimicrobium mesophilum]EYD75983.1 Oxalate/formate antiporter [Rubellimicrobium mesophilum DSM 19309]